MCQKRKSLLPVPQEMRSSPGWNRSGTSSPVQREGPGLFGPVEWAVVDATEPDPARFLSHLVVVQ
jgi:hypothetical protein